MNIQEREGASKNIATGPQMKYLTKLTLIPISNIHKPTNVLYLESYNTFSL